MKRNSSFLMIQHKLLSVQNVCNLIPITPNFKSFFIYSFQSKFSTFILMWQRQSNYKNILCLTITIVEKKVLRVHDLKLMFAIPNSENVCYLYNQKSCNVCLSVKLKWDKEEGSICHNPETIQLFWKVILTLDSKQILFESHKFTAQLEIQNCHSIFMLLFRPKRIAKQIMNERIKAYFMKLFNLFSMFHKFQ